MMKQTHAHPSRQPGQDRHRKDHRHLDRPERHCIAELARLDPGIHEANRLTGLLATLDRITRFSQIGAAQ
jgi:hypothetical protein